MKYLPQQVIFDLDDTLVHCNKYFDLILGQYFELMSGWFGNTARQPVNSAPNR